MQMRVGSMRTCIRGDKSVDVIGTPILGQILPSYLIRSGRELRPCQILSVLSHVSFLKFYFFYPDKMVPQGEIPKFHPGSAHTP